MSHSFLLTIWRDSVCAADDLNAPHELRLTIQNQTVQFVVGEVLRRQCPTSIEGGRATWLLEGNRPLAVLAQQWTRPRFLVDPNAPIEEFVMLGPPPGLRLTYLCQDDPNKVYERLREGRAL